MYTIILKKNEEKRIYEGHPWVFANEVASIEGKDIQGSIAKVLSFDKRFLGYGYINHKSKILVRLLTRDETVIDKTFFYNKIKKANDYRLSLGYSDNYRAVFGESDGLPALIVDKYGDYLSVQFLALGMEVRKAMIVECLTEIFSPKGIYERSDVKVRELEGLAEQKGVLYGEVPELVEITENGVKLQIDIQNGQKTGYFLDQKENRGNLIHYVKGKTVLDCFSNIGGFALCAARFGAKEVTALDISALAVESIRRNALLNGYQNIITAEAADVFDKLRVYKAEGRKFDVIVLDPPAFTKSYDTVKQGYAAYRDINSLALKLLNPGGFLVTCSCSQHLTINLFLDMLREASAYTRIPVRMAELRIQSRDHATLVNTEESLYLKAAVLYKE